MTERLFVAVDVAPEAVAALDRAVAPLRAAHPELSWTDPSRWHVTLAFAGQVEEAAAARVDAATTDAARAHPPVDLALTGALGTFGRLVLWAGLAAPDLSGLATELRGQLRARGVEIDEKPLDPHVTLARARRGQRLPRAIGEGFEGPRHRWRVSELRVLRVERRGGLRYAVRSVAPLAG